MLERCVGSLVGDGAVTGYPNLELVLVDHESTEPRARAVIDALAADPAHRVITFSGPFNFAAMVNRAAGAATGEVLVLLNNDTEAISPRLAGRDGRPPVPAGGGRGRGAAAVFRRHDPARRCAPGCGRPDGARPQAPPWRRPRLLRAAHGGPRGGRRHGCMPWRHQGRSGTAWGGLDEEHLAVAYNDIDLCLRAREAGLRVVFTPYAVLHHHESVSRGFDETRPATSAWPARLR